jgi:UDP-N-acetylglucosamine 2-epimerase (non-hydrolysing)
MRTDRIVVVLGTRPEAIKLAPVIRALDQRKELETVIVATGQHRQMLDQVLSRFQLFPDLDLDLMQPNQSLSGLTSRALNAIEKVIEETMPRLVMVQGDTTTAFVSALAAFYQKVPVAHVEAGLRSHRMYDPFPEEINRRLAGVVADIHLAPTTHARRNLEREGIPPQAIAVTGNTVVDALHALLQAPFSFEGTPIADLPLNGHRVLLVTSHRRESWGRDLENICLALRDLVNAYSDIRVVYPVHMNPNVRSTVHEIIGGVDRIHLTAPLDYLTFINLLRCSFMILTDSGGVQEEAPTLQKPLLLLRAVTERPEAFELGMAKVVGTRRDDIVREASKLLSDPNEYRQMLGTQNPYGDGRAGDRAAVAVCRWLRNDRPLLRPGEELHESAGFERSMCLVAETS